MEVASEGLTVALLCGVDVLFSSGGTNTVAATMPPWALGSLRGLPWKQGVSFSFTHEMCSGCSHDMNCTLSEDTVGSKVDQLGIWGVKWNT